jgi:hypothetical protein
VGVAVGSDLAGDVRAYLDAGHERFGALLLVKTGIGQGNRALRSGSDAIALAHAVRHRIRGALGRRPRRVLFFHLGPLAGAAFIGSHMNAVASEIQVFEDQGNTYAPSFLLR